MDSVTQTIVNYIEQTDVSNREDLLSVARIAFLDYLASLAPAESAQAVQDLARFIGADQNITVNPVSYTHLDVYKRQVVYRWKISELHYVLHALGKIFYTG